MLARCRQGRGRRRGAPRRLPDEHRGRQGLAL